MSVSDRGIGISAQQQTELFRPFERLEDAARPAKDWDWDYWSASGSWRLMAEQSGSSPSQAKALFLIYAAAAVVPGYARGVLPSFPRKPSIFSNRCFGFTGFET